MTVIDLKQYREENSPHLSGAAHCLNCQHDFQAVAPVGTTWLDCPACKLKRARYLERVQNNCQHWTCKCGCDLFYITPTNYYCPNCGTSQDFDGVA